MNEKNDDFINIYNIKETSNDLMALTVNQEEKYKEKMRRKSRKIILDKNKDEGNTKSQLQEEIKVEKNKLYFN